MPLILVVTDAGRQALINAEQDGTDAVRIATCGVSATAVVPARGATALPGEIKRIGTLSGGAVAPDVMHLVVRDETDDSYTLRSFALYLDNGTLFAIYGQPDPILEKSSQALVLLQTDVQLVDIAATQVTFGDANWLNPPATPETPGVVQMASDAQAAAMAERLRALSPANMAAIFTAANILSRLMQVDGAGSGLDADMLDGRQGNEFALLSGASFSGALTARANFASRPPSNPTTIEAAKQVVVGDTSGHPLYGFSVGYWLSNGQWRGLLNAVAEALPTALDIQPSGGLTAIGGPLSITGSITRAGSTVWDAGNDGAGSGLDADLLDGRQASEFALLSGATFSGAVRAPAFQADQYCYLSVPAAGLADVSFDTGDVLRYTRASNRYDFLIGSTSALTISLAGVDVTGQLTRAGNRVWDAGNDGAGSGLDADLLDGWHRDDVRHWDNLLARPASFPPAAHTHGAADILGAFDSRSFGVDGYQALPNGLILQWVAGASNPPGSESTQTVTYPIAFPNAVFRVFASTQISGATTRSDAMYQLVGAPGNGSCVVQRQRFAQDDVTSATPHIFAIGY